MAFLNYLGSLLFTSDRAKALRHWQFTEPGWEIKTTNGSTKTLGPEFVQLKIDILSQYGVENVRKAWLEVTSALEKEVSEIKKLGSSAWPEVQFDDVQNGSISAEKHSEIRKRGIVVVRNVFPEEQARGWHAQLKEYLNENPDILTVRSHTNSFTVQRFLNELWDGYGDLSNASPFPLSYADALRHRQPGGFSPVVQPHIDAGSLDRWADEDYRAAYAQIFSGHPLEHNGYDIEARRSARQDTFPGPQQSSVLRSFQGWTALSPQGGGFGKSALAVFPHNQLGIAYILLRPFFQPPADGSLDPARWELDVSDQFLGSAKGESQKVRPATHPHLQLHDTLALAPQINPGDLVFWHCDTVHAVDPSLTSPEPATVLYIAAVPTTEHNLQYLKGQRDALLDNGKTPPDFQRWFEQHEGVAKGWKAAKDIVPPSALSSFGLAKLPGDEGIIRRANEILELE
ncbi:hypothetical protein SCUCBS95973_007018 [Sporothrix curviconia]|uniref:DUF1479-domain-containing protein n=1 Tax=Sporothrix curviconia TaxID=1260050 RepID=A0ABP0CAJ4_9PEZI